jgi:hypothetical protein
VSNISNEGPPDNEADPQVDPLSVDRALANKIGRLPEPSAGFGSNLPWNQVLNVLDEIRYLNDRIRINTQETATYLRDHLGDLQKVVQSSSAEETRSQHRVRDQTPNTPNIPSPLVPEAPLLTIKKQLLEKRSAILGADNPERVSQLADLGLIDERGNVKIRGARNITSEELEQVSQVHQGKLDVSTLDPTLQHSAARFGQTLDEALTKASKNEIARARGLESLSQGFSARRLLGGMGVGHHGPAAAIMGNGPEVPLGTGIADMFSRRTVSTRLRDVLESASARRTEAGAEAGLGTRLGGAASNRILATLGGAAIPGIGEIMLAGTLLSEFGHHIPGVAQAEQLSRVGQQFRQAGQLTGEDVGAGFQARLEAARLTPGGVLSTVPVIGGIAGTVGHLLHPFDPITNEIANQIVESVRTQGFTGPRAHELYQGVADVYRDLGLSIDTTTKMITDATRTGGESLKQIVTEMKGFDTAAHDLGVNINEYAQSVEETAGTFRAGGAGPLATTRAQQFISGAPRILQTGAGLQAYSQSFQNAAPTLAATLGIPQQYLPLSENIDKTLPAFEKIQNEQFAMMQGNNMEEKAANAALMAPVFRGLDVPQIIAIMRRNASGRGPEGIARMQSAARNYGTSIMAIRDTGHMQQLSKMSYDQLAQHGITHRVGYDDKDWFFNKAGQRIAGDTKMKVMDTMSQIGPEHLLNLRQNAINQVRDILRPGQIKTLESHLKDPNFGFRAKLQSYENLGGRKRNAIDTPFGEIRISFAGKAKKALRADVSQKSWQSGFTQANQSFPYVDERVDPLGP